jgi:hypothetical protein
LIEVFFFSVLPLASLDLVALLHVMSLLCRTAKGLIGGGYFMCGIEHGFTGDGGFV